MRWLAATFFLLLIAGARAQATPAPEPAPVPNTDAARPKESTSEERHADEMGTRAYCGSLAATKPRRLAPGQEGVFSIVLALQAMAVIEAETEFKVTFESDQGPIALGVWARRPAKTSKRYARYYERGVYDDTVVIDIPVRVAATATYGSHPVRVQIETTLHDGDSGEPLGHFSDLIAGLVEVGLPLPRPTVVASPQNRQTQLRNPPATAATEVVKAREVLDGPPDAVPMASGGNPLLPTGQPSDGVPTASFPAVAELPEEEGGGGRARIWLIAGVVAAAGLVSIVLARRR